jgi:hypothetical protein
MNIVLFGKCAALAVLVLPYPADKVVCDAYVEYRMVGIGQDIDIGALTPRLFDPLVPRRNDPWSAHYE